MSKKTFFSCIHLYLLYLAVYVTFDSNKIIGCGVIAGIVFGIVLLGNVFQKRVGFFLGAVLVEIVVLMGIRNLAELIMFSVFVLITMIAFLLKSAGEQEPVVLGISPVWLIFILLCHIPLYFTKYPGEEKLCAIGAAYVLVYLLSMAVENMEDFKILHKRMDKLPVVQLGKVYFFSVAFVVLWVFLGMLLGRNQVLADYLAGKINTFLSALSGEPIKMTPDGGGGGATNLFGVEKVQQGDGAEQMIEEAYEGSPLFGYILKLLLYIILFVLVLYVVYGIYCYLKRDKSDEGDVIEFIKETYDVSEIYPQEFKERRKRRKTLSANEMIRKIYKKKIKSGIKERIPFWATPKELEAMADWQNTGENSELHRLYEKARYSKEGCEKAEVDRYTKNSG